MYVLNYPSKYITPNGLGGHLTSDEVGNLDYPGIHMPIASNGYLNGL